MHKMVKEVPFKWVSLPQAKLPALGNPFRTEGLESLSEAKEGRTGHPNIHSGSKQTAKLLEATKTELLAYRSPHRQLCRATERCLQSLLHSARQGETGKY